MDEIDDVGEVKAVAVRREPRLLAASLLLAPVAVSVVLAVQVNFLFLMLAPIFSVFAYGAWLGLTNNELIKAFGNARTSDETGINPF